VSCTCPRRCSGHETWSANGLTTILALLKNWQPLVLVGLARAENLIDENQQGVSDCHHAGDLLLPDLVLIRPELVFVKPFFLAAAAQAPLLGP